MKTIYIIVAFILGMGLLSSMTSCSSEVKQDKTIDSVEFAVYASKPIDYPEDCDPVYIDINDLGLYHSGDTIEVNDYGRIPAIIHSRKKDLSEYGTHLVILQERINHNKWISRDQAESEQ
jgi:hypothetical protein